MSRPDLGQLMDIENASHTQPYMVPLVQNLASPEGEPVHEFLHVLEDTFSHDEVWPQPCDHLYVSLRGGCSAGKEPDADTDTGPARQFDEPEELERLPINEVATENLHEPATHIDQASNEIPGQSVDPDDLPEVNIDRPLGVTFGKELGYALTLMELIRCRRHRGGTLQPVKVWNLLVLKITGFKR